jgi:hypothetical protein
MTPKFASDVGHSSRSARAAVRRLWRSTWASAIVLSGAMACSSSSAVDFPQGSSQLTLPASAACGARPDECPSGAAAAEDAIFQSIRKCAPASVSNLCAFEYTFEADADGCVTRVFALAPPAGVALSTADAIDACVAQRLVASRWSCLASRRVRPGCP